MFALGQVAMPHERALIFAVRAIEDAGAIPDRFDKDEYWH